MHKSRLDVVRKWLLTFIVIALSAYAGFLFGERRLQLSFKNWRQPVTFNRSAVLDQAKERQGDFSQFWEVWDRLNAQYVDKTLLDSDKMIQGAISGMVSALGDPYTVYLPPQQNKTSKEELGGEFSGVGLQLGFKDKQLAVVAPLDGTPGFKAGIKSGDLIVRITDTAKKVDRTTQGMSLPEAVDLIRGDKGTRVKLTLVREGTAQPFDVDLTRDTIVVKSVALDFKTKNNKPVAVIKLSQFGDRTQDEWNSAVSQIVDKCGTKGEKCEGMVLDLRNNPGGYLESAVYVAGEFLTPGKIVVTQQYGDGSRTDHKVDRNGRLLTIPMVVMVNGGSASAAEILSGSLQDHRRAKIIGEQSFGKGSVQQPEDFPDGAGVHITIAKWLLPSGNWVDKQGITPDVKIESVVNPADETLDVQLNKAIEVL